MNEPATSSPKILVGIADDSDTYREALRFYLSGLNDVSVLFEVSDGAELIKKLETHQPQVVLLDLDMPNVDGMQALIQIRDLYPSVKFIMLTMFMEKALISACIENGANSYLNKMASPEEIYAAIIKCCEADFYMNDWISEALVSNVKHPRKT
jgi:DNA-binding NarL/FixJ family response regulator